jgi:hypothetical protein
MESQEETAIPRFATLTKSSEGVDEYESPLLYLDYTLNLANDEIRLLHIRPGAWNDPIKCDYSIVSLNDGPSYFALSYVWGKKTTGIGVTVSGRTVRVLPNLYSALRRLRAHGEYENVWIDALCINQGWYKERNHQVGLMGKIYSRCAKVLVWFGEGMELDRPDARCFAFAMPSSRIDPQRHLDFRYEDGGDQDWRNCRIIHQSYDHQIFQTIRDIFCYAHGVDALSIGNDKVSPRFVDKEETDLRRLLQDNTWFERLWVVQEFVLSLDCELLLGPVAVPSEILRTAHMPIMKAKAKNTSGYFNRVDVYQKFCDRVNELYSLRHKVKNDEYVSMFTLRLSLLRKNCSTTANIDQIYALLELCGRRTGISPDYNRSLEGVYTAVVEEHICQFSLLPLVVTGLGYRFRCRFTHLASWAFDWTQRARIGFSPLAWSKLYSTFSASLGLPQELQKSWVKIPHLYLHGVLVDRVASLNDSEWRSDPGSFESLVETLEEKAVYGHSNYLNGESWTDALTRTLCVDNEMGLCRYKRETKAYATIIYQSAPAEHIRVI